MHDHHNEIQNSLSFKEKLIKLLEHWIKHNNDHAETYNDWANKAKLNDMAAAVESLEEAADMTLQINKKLFETIALMKDEK